MAGIGFVVRRLIRQENLTSIFGGYLVSALFTAGPWLFTILALGTIGLLAEQHATSEQMAVFRLVVIYNFSISLVVCGPLSIIVTRYISDKIYLQDVSEVPGILIGSLATLLFGQFPFILFFYFGFLEIPPEMALAGTVNYLCISSIWLVSVFLSALKDYRTICTAFACGMLLAVLSGLHWMGPHAQTGILWGFNLGLGTILFSLIVRILAEYPHPFSRVLGFAGYFKTFWDLSLCGLFYNLAIWVDKWIMWFSPHRQVLSNGFISYPNYDTAMFLAYLTIIPSMAIFFVNVETNFFEKYVSFYKDIQGHASYRRILENQKSLMRVLFENSRNLILFQGSISLLAVLFAPRLFDILNINYLLLGMFRIGVLGAFFHILAMFLFIILFYFDFRKPALCLNGLLLVTNALFTWMTLEAGFPYYGFGYFLSALITFACAYGVTLFYLGKLPYQTFVANNPALRK